MEKINWINKQDGLSTPLTAENLNAMQTNAENEFHKVLYKDDLKIETNNDISKIKYNNEFVTVAPMFPVGAVYLSTTPENPSKYFGGTWERIANGKTLIGVDEADNDFNKVAKTGGEKEHTLTHQELPRLSFKIPHVAYYDNVTVEDGGFTQERENSNYEGNTQQLTNDGWHKLSVGDNQPHNNLPPYFTVFIWKRIS